MAQPTWHEGSEAHSDHSEEVHHCAFHPGVETGLSCSRCGKYICTRCMVQAPVGIRCRECGDVQKLPTFDVRPSYYFRAGVAAGMVSVAVGVVWGGIAVVLPHFALSWVLALGSGYVIGEAVAVATNRKRGPGLMAIAGAGLLAALVTAGIMQNSIFPWFFTSLLGILFLAMALFAAVNRVR